jgi:hypothetical protein
MDVENPSAGDKNLLIHNEAFKRPKILDYILSIGVAEIKSLDSIQLTIVGFVDYRESSIINDEEPAILKLSENKNVTFSKYEDHLYLILLDF